ncbi:hypothetical protein GCK72_000337 [Caenorhabditis remanei]|uniref:Phospholipid scramblase n=1 Tax=Caenorhabditis remanei TaxID=31234 RepID=A0A6A5HLU3_CAERE|nr:hypothetical protein GCK72_000337 [Caenorhabditis remanei]KAF1768525.1 hypothetical protein GCK72_000337 [Caenorhabditis remanei]
MTNVQPGQLPLKSRILTLTSPSESSATSSENENQKNKKELVPVRATAGRMRRGGALPTQRAEPIHVPNQVAQMPIVMTGFVSLVPHTVLDAIAMTNCLMVVQCTEPLEIFTGIETPNRYVVHDMYLRPILFCAEKSNFISRECCGSGRNFTMEIRDMYGAELMKCYRDNPCFSCTDFLGTQFQGQQIGLMKKECCDGDFKLLGAGCNQPLLIRSPCCASCGGTQIFPVLTYTGIKVGEIVRLYPGFLQEAFTDADTYLVHFPYDLPPILKLLLISSVFLIDFTYFEDNN